MQEIRRAQKATHEEVDAFLKGSNPQEHIIKVECGYDDRYATVIWRDDNFIKHYDREPFYPFCWAKQEAGRLMFGGDRTLLKFKMQEFGIGVKNLIVANADGNIPERMENGYRNLWYATKPMSNQEFSKFFDDAKVPLRPKERDKTYGKNLYKTVAPNEQFMIATGKRLFKGYESYDDILRFQFDIETSGLNPLTDTIDQIGIRTNKGFEKIITVTGEGEEKHENEHKAMLEFYSYLAEIDPDVVAGYNSENFDWNFYDKRGATLFNTPMAEMSKVEGLERGIYKKKQQAVLKLGGEMEYYYPTVIWGKHVTDCLFSVRRAQALDSNMKKATLKYVTKYSKINKKNRVYVPGKIINTTWADKDNEYAFNDANGDWYMITDSKPLKEGYEIVTGQYIVERYLLDDLWETDKVELRYNESNFLVGKMLPVNFERMCTMGTATIWKYIMMAWSYEHDLAIPLETSSRSFTGGLSRLLTVGYIPNVQKLDYNSLYPSIILSFGIKSPIDISDAMPAMLEYILTQREYFKGLKGKYGKEAKGYGKQIAELLNQGADHLMIESLKVKQDEASALSTRNDKMQLPLKITGNAYFGSFGSGGGVFPWSDIDCAEETTCCGRQMLRLMLKWFQDLGYEGIVCDSVTGDTPLFIRYNGNSGLIDIKPIEELFDTTHSITRNDNRQYDLLTKDYQVLCRSGWMSPSYFYRHESDKDVYRVDDNKSCVDVTKDHSLFNDKREEIKPEQITQDTKLEYYNGESIFDKFNTVDISDKGLQAWATMLKKRKPNRLPVELLNATLECKKTFLNLVSDVDFNLNDCSKTLVAGIQFLKNCVLL